MARRRVFQRAAPRRRMTWEGSQVDMTMTSGASTVLAIVTEATLENIPNPTIVRVRGNLLLRVTAQGAAGTRGILFLGIKLTTATALAATAVEVPGTDIGSDWLWWEARGFSTLDTGIGQSNNQQTYVHLPIDSKAMRKVEINQVLVLVVQHTALVSTQTLQATGGLRILLKL